MHFSCKPKPRMRHLPNRNSAESSFRGERSRDWSKNNYWKAERPYRERAQFRRNNDHYNTNSKNHDSRVAILVGDSFTTLCWRLSSLLRGCVFVRGHVYTMRTKKTELRNAKKEKLKSFAWHWTKGEETASENITLARDEVCIAVKLCSSLKL